MKWMADRFPVKIHQGKTDFVSSGSGPKNLVDKSERLATVDLGGSRKKEAIMAQKLKLRLVLLGTLLAFTANTGKSQIRLERVQYKSGRVVSGEILEVKKKHIVLARKIGMGSIREKIPFDRIEPVSLYTCLVSALSPLDKQAHMRIGEAAFAAELYPTAKRHFLKSATDPKKPTAPLRKRIEECESRDIAKLLKRSMAELSKEHFKMARRIALMAMKRYPDHVEARVIPTQLDRIKRRFQSARKRDAALATTKRQKAMWDAAEKSLLGLDAYLVKAEKYEIKSLRSSKKLRRSKGYIDLGLRELVRADKNLWRLKQSGSIPAGLKDRLIAADDTIITMQIRLRLHLASLYSVRGSYGTALSWANDALSFDPTDKSALDARARIETSAAAASARGGFGGRLRR